jgi:hypothetical protein
MVTQRLLPIGYSYENRLHSSTEIKKISDNAIVHIRRGLVFCKVTSSKRKTCNYRFQLTGHE